MPEDYNAYMRRYMAERYSRRRAAAIDLLGGECVICGSTDRLEIDHVDPATKSFSIGPALPKLAWAKLLAELAKCQLLCREHHEAKSAGEQAVEHGGGLSGRSRCPCPACRQRKAEYMRAWYAARRSAPVAQPDRASVS